jgi:hypothetical protein
MLRLLERNISSVHDRLLLLAPPGVAVPQSFDRVGEDPREHERLLQEMQRLRGSIYLHDGAVQREQLSSDGRHRTPEDVRSWHLLMMNRERRVTACAWYLQHGEGTTFDRLRVRSCPLARIDGWRQTLWLAIQSEIARARHDRLGYAEVGGWAVVPESRCSSEGLLLALAAYSLGRVMGGVLGLTTATVRHSSSAILRRLGGSALEMGGESVPSYYDPKYRCEMELLRFDSRKPNPRYAALIELLREKLSTVAVVAQGIDAAEFTAAAPEWAAA